MQMVDDSEEQLNESLDRLQKLLVESEQYDFVQSTRESEVIIKPD